MKKMEGMVHECNAVEKFFKKGREEKCLASGMKNFNSKAYEKKGKKG